MHQRTSYHTIAPESSLAARARPAGQTRRVWVAGAYGIPSLAITRVKSVGVLTRPDDRPVARRSNDHDPRPDFADRRTCTALRNRRCAARSTPHHRSRIGTPKE